MNIVLFIQDMLFYHSAFRNYNLWPETGLGMNDNPITQDNTGSNHSIVFNAAVFTNMSTVVHYTSRDGAVHPDNNPVVK